MLYSYISTSLICIIPNVSIQISFIQYAKNPYETTNSIFYGFTLMQNIHSSVREIHAYYNLITFLDQKSFNDLVFLRENLVTWLLYRDCRSSRNHMSREIPFAHLSNRVLRTVWGKISFHKWTTNTKDFICSFNKVKAECPWNMRIVILKWNV